MKFIANNLVFKDTVTFLEKLELVHGSFSQHQIAMIAELLSEDPFNVLEGLPFLDKHHFNYDSTGQYEIYCGVTNNLLLYACHHQHCDLVLQLLARGVNTQVSNVYGSDDRITLGPIECLLVGLMDGYQTETDITVALKALLAHGTVQLLSVDELEDFLGDVCCRVDIKQLIADQSSSAF